MYRNNSLNNSNNMFDYTSYPTPLKKHRDTFIYGLMDDLVEAGVSAPYARSIGGSICELMSNDALKYHNYIHPLAMFSFAEKHGIKLELFERLSVWFHDAIYVVNAPNNERKSADLLWSLVPENELFTKVWHQIDMTAMFLDETSYLKCLVKPGQPSDYFRVMDLDLSSFALPYENFKRCAKLVQDELGTSPKQSIKFYDLLIKHGPIFRTSEFSQFESVAMNNIESYKKEFN